MSKLDKKPVICSECKDGKHSQHLFTYQCGEHVWPLPDGQSGEGLCACRVVPVGKEAKMNIPRIDTECPQCGSQLTINSDTHQICCARAVFGSGTAGCGDLQTWIDKAREALENRSTQIANLQEENTRLVEDRRRAETIIQDVAKRLEDGSEHRVPELILLDSIWAIVNRKH